MNGLVILKDRDELGDFLAMLEYYSITQAFTLKRQDGKWYLEFGGGAS